MGTAIFTALRAIFIKLISAIAAKAFLEWLLFWVADLIVKSTKTELDDKFLKELKAAYNDGNLKDSSDD